MRRLGSCHFGPSPWQLYLLFFLLHPLGMERERESRTRDRSRKRRRRHRGVEEHLREEHARSRRKDAETREPTRGWRDTSEPRRPVTPPWPSRDPPSPRTVGGMSGPGSWAKPAAPPARASCVRPEGERDARSRASGSQEAKSMSTGRGIGRLGKTSGITAAGAWAARLELASLLEAKCDLMILAKEIREGKEGDHFLKAGGELPAPKATGDEASESERESLVTQEMLDNPLEEEVERQKAILNSIALQQGVPAWANPYEDTSSTTSLPISSLNLVGELSFSKKATPPPNRMDRLRSPSVEVVRKKREESPLKFAKPARPPQEGQGPLEEALGRIL